MRLTLQTDYGLRILIYLGVRKDSLVSARDIAEAYKIPLNHIKKIITHLVKGGYILSVRGRNGGIKIGQPASSILLGDLIAYLDQEGRLLRCMNGNMSCEESQKFCVLSENCGLKPLLRIAQRAFLKQMNTRTLSDVIGKNEYRLFQNPLQSLLAEGSL